MMGLTVTALLALAFMALVSEIMAPLARFLQSLFYRVKMLPKPPKDMSPRSPMPDVRQLTFPRKRLPLSKVGEY